MSRRSWHELAKKLPLGPQAANFLAQQPLDGISLDDHQGLTHFLHPGAVWSPEELDRVWSVYEPLICHQEEIYPITIGLPTPENPQLINPLLATIWAHRAGLNLNESNLADGLNLRSKSNNDLLTLLCLNLDLSPPMSRQLIHMILSLPEPKFSAPKYTGGHIKNAFWRLSNQHVSYEELDPQTTLEAIVLAAINYKTNLLPAADPMRCYHQIKHLQDINDELATPILRFNPNALDLEKYFEPRFPTDFWSFRRLCDLAITEGYVNANFRDSNPYELLQIAYLENNFYEGPYVPGSSNELTPIYQETIADLDPHQILSYGIYDISVVRFTYREWKDAFQHAGDWVHPLNREKISNRAINKLRQFLVNYDDPEKIELLTVMKDIEISLDVKTLELGQFVADCPKDYILHLLNRLLEVMWRMRGWLGGDFPLTSAPVNDQEAVDSAVMNALLKLEEEALEQSEYGQRFLDLPLMRYDQDTQTFIRSNCSDNGLTIRERIQIVYKAESTESCIRLTSNWFGATYCYYCKAFGLIPSFDLQKLRYIS